MSMYYLVLTPNLSNVFERGPAAIAPTPAEDSVFVASKLYDRSAQEIFRFTSLAADSLIKKDINLLTNPTFATAAVNWTSLGGNVRYQDITVQPGEFLTLTVVTNASTTGSVQNLRSGNYLTSAGLWQSGSTTCYSVNGTASVAFQVESLIANKGQHAVPLRVAVADYTKNTSLIIIPAVNMCSVFGHGLGNVTSLFEWSDNDSAWTTAATMSIDQPAYFTYLSSPLYHRYWRVKFGGTNHEIIWLGELVAGHALTMDPAPMWDWKENEDWPSHVHKNDAGQSTVRVMTVRPTRTLTMDFIPTNLTDDPARLIAMRRAIWERSKAGSYPVVVIVRSSRADVLLGRFKQEFGVGQMIPNAQRVNLDIVGLPFPIVGVVTAAPED